MKKLIVFVTTMMFLVPVAAKQEKAEKAGGVRADHASEMGLEKGKAWAGSNEKKVKDDSPDKEKGKSAGGVRDDHASDMGLEKGEAWAGSKEKKVKDESGESGEKEKKEKKSK